MNDVAFTWDRYCDLLIQNRELKFSLDVSRVRFTREDLEPLIGRLTSALGAMAALEAGAIANPDESRMVGHYWLRDADLAPSPDITDTIRGTLEDIQSFVADVHQGVIRGGECTFENILHVGIGGSALGPQFIAAALGTGFDPLTIHFVDNTDPDGIDQTISLLHGQLDSTLVVVVSKSGGTPETRNGMLEIQRAYAEQNVDFASHAVAITQSGSQLDALAKSEGWLKTFPMWDWVGGRTSVLSAVGLLPAALQGIDIEALLSGAAEMDKWTRSSEIWQNPAAMLAAVWFHVGGGLGRKDMVVLPYKDRLSLFSRYLQQLVMESLGKELNRRGNRVEQGLAVYGNKGSTDQHAYVQQLRDGLNNFFAVFIQVLKDRDEPELEVEPGVTTGDFLHGFLLGTRQALSENGRDCVLISIDEVDAQSVGALIALFERAVGIYAEMIDINAYHQPGVEAGKKAASQILSLQKKIIELLKTSPEPLSAEAIKGQLAAAETTETVYKILEHLAANQNRGVEQVEGTSPRSRRYAWRAPD